MKIVQVKAINYLQLILIKDTEEIIRYNFIQSLEKGVHFRLDFCGEAILGKGIEVLFLVLIRDSYFEAIWY
jgi:hypothetical protein